MSFESVCLVSSSLSLFSLVLVLLAGGDGILLVCVILQ